MLRRTVRRASHFKVLNKLRSPSLRLELFGLKTPGLEVLDGIGAGTPGWAG